MENFDLDIKKNEEEESTLNYSLIAAIIIGLLLIGGVAYWFFTKDKSSEDVENQELTMDEENAGVNDSATEKVIDSTGFEQNATDETAVDTSGNDTTGTTTGDNQAETDTESVQNNETAANADDYVYFIVSGAFRNENNAQNKLQNLKNQGFNAVIVGPTAKALYIVAYEGFTNLNDAKIKLKDIRQSNSQAWIYKKR